MELPIPYQKLMEAFRNLKVTKAEITINTLKWAWNNDTLEPLVDEYLKHREIFAITLWQMHVHMNDKPWQEVAAGWAALPDDMVSINNTSKNLFRKIADDLLKLIKY